MQAKLGLTSAEDLRRILSNYLNNNVLYIGDELKLSKPIVIFDRLYDTSPEIGHWNLIYRVAKNTIFVYDPYGIPFYSDKFKNLKVIYSLDQDQKINEKSCGMYCIRKLFQIIGQIKVAKNYLIVDYKNKEYQFHLDKDFNKDRFKKYKDIYELLQNSNELRKTKPT